MAVYGLTIFIGAFLLFQVQPLIGKYILPWFGGGPGVWTTCMLFFQALLLGGYAYAHFGGRWLKPRVQAALHLLLLLVSVALLPIIPSPHWKPQGGDDPTTRILGLLAATIGLPYFVLSATGPLMQHWFSRTRPGASPYRLFALSNAGSLLALISYPLFFEVQFTRRTQAAFWGSGLIVFLVAAAACAWKLWKHVETPAEQGAALDRATAAKTAGRGPGRPTQPQPQSRRTKSGKKASSPMGSTVAQWVFWLLLPACASVLLLATTNKLCQDIAVIPFLWVLPLALYLISFIICFDNPRWYWRLPFSIGLIVAMAASCRLMFEGTDATLPSQIITYSSMLFLGCMVCHGELYRLKPDPTRLTSFYLAIAAGGALGGFFVAIVAPLLFTNYYEWHWGMIFCVSLMLAVWIRERRGSSRQSAEETAAAAEYGGRDARQWIWMAGALGVLIFSGLDRLFAVVGRAADADLKFWIGGLRIACWLILMLWVLSWILRKRHQTFRHGRRLACGLLLLLLVVLAGALGEEARDASKEAIYRSRNFYGVLSVFEYQKEMPRGRYLLLQHGGITHGLQFTHPDQALWSTTYYGPGSGIAKGVDALPAGPRRIGVVGLGTGTMAAFGRAGDYLRIYEINPEVIRLAHSHFTYLSNCPAKVEIALGDARLSLESEPGQQFDLLALDAFSSDAIPVHLLTKEAFELYQRHLKTNGVIAVHVSNHYLDLEPVVVNLARQFQYQLAIIDYDEEEDDWWYYSSTWLLLSRNRELIGRAEIQASATTPKTNSLPLWTDDFASLLQIFQK
jgi:hypothetical protein